MSKRTIVFESDAYGYIWATPNSSYVTLMDGDKPISKILLKDLRLLWDTYIRGNANLIMGKADTGILPNVTRWFNVDSKIIIVERAPTNYLPWTLWSFRLGEHNEVIYVSVHASEYSLGYSEQPVVELEYAQELMNHLETSKDLEAMSFGPAISFHLDALFPALEKIAGVDHGSPVQSMKQIPTSDGDLVFQDLVSHLDALVEEETKDKKVVKNDLESPFFSSLAELIQTHGRAVT